jgi:preprotein translocase subunit SecB
MTQDSGDDGQGGAGEAQPPLMVQAQYVKDLSFEAPAVPGIFNQLQQHKPDINIKVDVQARPLAETQYEVVLHVHVECKAGPAVAFVAELAYGGLFVVNVAAADVKPVLLIECPRLLFPFARQIVAQTTMDGGFMPLMLAPIDFVQLYRRQQAPSPVAADEGEARLV